MSNRLNFNYLAFIYAGLPEASNNAFNDGVYLATKCLDNLKDIDNKEGFPPRLLILLASPAYNTRSKAERLLRGVNSTIKGVPLIGSSVGGVFFDRNVHPRGALLICLASNLIDARVAVGTNARRNRKGAINKLLKALKLHPAPQIDINPLANRAILTFMPGCNKDARDGAFYPAPELHRLLNEGLQSRIWLSGGVSSADDPTRQRDGFQFAHGKVLKDAIVAASIITGVPIGLSLNDSLKPTRKILRVTKLGRDSRTVKEFNNKPAADLFNSHRNLMIAKLLSDGERIVDIPRPLADGSVQLLRQIELRDYFQVFHPAPEIVETAHRGINAAKKRVYVERPIGTLLFSCKIYRPRDKQGMMRAAKALTQIETFVQGESKKGRPCVGGFFDGEIGIDEKGRSRLTNAGVAYMIFGDEIRERTPLYKGVSALAKYGPTLLSPARTHESIYVTIRNALNIVTETGFPGAMLSLILSNLDRETSVKKRYIIARETVGQRFAKIKNATKRPVEGHDVLALVAKDKKARFIPDSRTDSSCDQDAIKRSGIISQYVVPLKRADKTVFGILQVDLGDLRHLTDSAFRNSEKARMLNCLAEVISGTINRIGNAVENEIKLDLDKALAAGLSANTVHKGLDTFFRAAGKAFGVEMGHLRLVEEKKDSSRVLVLESGFGVNYEAEKIKRREIDTNDDSPICQAFRSTAPHIVNDVDEDPAFQRMLESIRPPHPDLYETLCQTKSYAAISFSNEEGKRIGALSLGSIQPWFFLKLHRAALQALAERTGFLIQSLKAKVARNFLLAVSPKLAKRDLNEARKIFQNVTSDFRRALNAEVASLYLRDEDTGKYVLRAESNWKDKNWIDAARYGADSGWIGVNEEPTYVPDLRKYYFEREYDFPHGRYAEYMFGQELSENFAVEAIALPLRIGPEHANGSNDSSTDPELQPGIAQDKESKFGVLTLYRRIDPGNRTGFITTESKLLQEGTYNAAGLVNATLWHRANKWEKQEEKRRNRLYQGLSFSEHKVFEARICLEVLKTFGAAEVDFYRLDRSGKKTIYSWIAGSKSLPHSKKIEKLEAPSADHRQILAESADPAEGKQARVVCRRRQLRKGQQEAPDAVKMEGLVEQVCVPLVGDRKHLASLLIRWRIGPKSVFSLASKHSDFHLQVLGRILGSAYSKDRIKRIAQRSNKAVQTAGLYVFQHAHKLVNAVQDLYRLGQLIKSASNENGREAKIEELETTAEGYIDTLNWVFDLGEAIQNPSQELIPVTSFVKQCWSEVERPGHTIDKVEFPSVEDIAVSADPKLTKEVFLNLMNNAITATEKQKTKTGGESTLNISAVVSEDKETVKIIFSDNGIGMTRKEREDAYSGFKPTGRVFHNIKHKGVGVLVSRFLLGVQDGYLDHVSKRGNGTQAIVTLPNFRIEGRRDEVAITD